MTPSPVAWLVLGSAVATCLVVGLVDRVSAQPAAERERRILERERRLKADKQREAEALSRSAAASRAAAEQARIERDTYASLDLLASELVDRLTAVAEMEIVDKGDGVLFVAGGRNAGMRVGEKLRCVSRGKPIELRGEVIGYAESELGEGTVKAVREKISLLSFDKPGSASKGDVCYRAARDTGTVTVLPFPYEGRRTWLSDFLAQEIQRGMVEAGVKVVERAQLTQLVAEQELGESILAGEAGAVRLGRLVGAKMVVLGTIRNLPSNIRVEARLASAESSQIVATASGELQTNRFLLDLLKRAPAAADAVYEKALESATEERLDHRKREAAEARAEARAHLEQGDTKLATEAFLRALKLQPSAPENTEIARRLGKSRRYEQDVLPEVQRLREMANRALLGGDLYMAKDAITLSVALAPDDESMVEVAEAVEARCREEAAVARKEAAAKISLGEFGEAAELVVRAISLDPNSAKNVELLRQLRAIHAERKAAEAKRFLLMARQFMAAAKYDDADLTLAAAAALTPDHPGIERVAATIRDERGKSRVDAFLYRNAGN